MLRSHRFRSAMPLLLAGLLAPLPSQAAIFTVGPIANGCTHPTLVAAVTAAEANPGPDTIRATRSVTYSAQELVINTQQELDLVGGFASCTSTAADGTQTVLDGAGGSAAPVLRISANSATAIVRLRMLRITGGDSTGDGGGIRFTGRGTLVLTATTLNLNDADAGGGIHVRGTGSETRLVIGSNNLIAGNRARSGGGIYLESADLRMVEPGSSIFANTATESGGGLRIYATDGNPASATIGSTGFQSVAAIEGNSAAVGGGVALFATNDASAGVSLVGASAAAPVAVRENFASQRGGAIDLQPTVSLLSSGFASATLVNAALDGNAAPAGPAVYSSNESVAAVTLGATVELRDSRVDGNASLTAANVPTDGPILVITEGGIFRSKRMVYAGNEGGPLIRAGSADIVFVSDSLFHSNTVRGSVLSIAGETFSTCSAEGTTFAGNAIQASAVILAECSFLLRNSIVWQPGMTTLQAGTRSVLDVLASEITSLGSGNSIVSAQPRFIDPAGGDFRLQAASPAIDFSRFSLGDGRDLNGAPRGIDLARVTNVSGAIDLGAYERDQLGNLALNPQFLADRRLWDAGIPGSTATWVSAGAANGGGVSLSMVAAPGGTFTGLRQCVRIPGPGRYRLSGLAYGSGADALTRDDVSLRWDLRYNTGGETCTGTIDAQGSVEFNNTASWSAPPSLGLIDVSPSLFSRFTNVEVLLQVREGSLNVNATSTGFFDEITLVAEDTTVGDAVFANGFEPLVACAQADASLRECCSRCCPLLLPHRIWSPTADSPARSSTGGLLATARRHSHSTTSTAIPCPARRCCATQRSTQASRPFHSTSAWRFPVRAYTSSRPVRVSTPRRLLAVPSSARCSMVGPTAPAASAVARGGGSREARPGHR